MRSGRFSSSTWPLTPLLGRPPCGALLRLRDRAGSSAAWAPLVQRCWAQVGLSLCSLRPAGCKARCGGVSPQLRCAQLGCLVLWLPCELGSPVGPTLIGVVGVGDEEARKGLWTAQRGWMALLVWGGDEQGGEGAPFGSGPGGSRSCSPGWGRSCLRERRPGEHHSPQTLRTSMSPSADHDTAATAATTEREAQIDTPAAPGPGAPLPAARPRTPPRLPPDACSGARHGQGLPAA